MRLTIVQQQQFAAMQRRSITSHHITKNIELITQSKDSNLPANRPLTVILCWLGSRRKDIMKFANVYIEQDFDVVTVHTSPWQFMWPTKGIQVIMADLINFLHSRNDYDRIFLHGFSIGGYMWGEALELMNAQSEKYQPVCERIVGQVWDSAADIDDIPFGTARAIFPNNPKLQDMLRKYLEYHMKTFYQQSTIYYKRAREMFHSGMLSAPALILVSKADPVGTVAANSKLRDNWESVGMTTYMKIFENSPHVCHYRLYPKEYIAELYAFLDKLNLIRYQEKIRARL